MDKYQYLSEFFVVSPKWQHFYDKCDITDAEVFDNIIDEAAATMTDYAELNNQLQAEFHGVEVEDEY